MEETPPGERGVGELAVSKYVFGILTANALFTLSIPRVWIVTERERVAPKGVPEQMSRTHD